MTADESRVPVVVGAGQAIERRAIVITEQLCERAARDALDEAPRLAERIGRVAVVSSVFSPSSRRGATQLGEVLRLVPGERETTTVGGNTPQWLVTRASEQIASGELAATLIAGAESPRSARASGAQDQLFGRNEKVQQPEDPVVGTADKGLLSSAELAIRLYQPAQLYPMFESAMAARAGRSPGEQRRHLGRLLAPFTDVAAGHPFAWFRGGRRPTSCRRRRRRTGSPPSRTPSG